ncbi:MAG: hypothetical protein JWP44_3251 [Mucilaginibacter sp.]|nr:hypothetical protein [Mucilaginibacter sp.]
MSEKYQVAVVIPFYRNTISAYEKIALEQCEKVLSNHPKIAIKPQNLVLPEMDDIISFSNVISFEDKYFKNIKGYNSLMLADLFYEKFLEYEYILIYQLDAFVFTDDLIYWCKQDYDYIGAPWLRKKDYPHLLKELSYKILFNIYTRYNITKKGVPGKKQFDDKVGNGGFSLRRVSKFHSLSISMLLKIQKYLSRDEHEFNEDAFWSVEVNRKKKLLNIPSYKVALKFSIENAPARATKLNNSQLPFGCHAWDRHVDFWRPIFKHYGYNI